MRWVRWCVVMLIAVPCSTRRLHAQDSTAAAPRDWVTSVSLGLPRAEAQWAPDFITVGIATMSASPRALGLHVGADLLPVWIGQGVVSGAVRAGPVLPLPVARGITLFPTAGATALGSLSPSGIQGVYGWHTGISAVLDEQPLDGARARRGLRLSASWHWLGEAREPLLLLEAGISFRHR